MKIIQYCKSHFFLCLSMLFLVSCQGNGTDGANEENGNGNRGHTRITELSEQIQEDPNNGQLYLERAELYDVNGELEPAIRDAEKAATLDSTKASNHIFLGTLYEKRPYPRGAIGAYEKAVQINPKDKSTFLKLGILYFQLKDRNNSFKNLNEAIKLDDQLAEAFYYRGYNYREENMPDKAIENFNVARNLKQDYLDAYLQLGLIYAEKKDKRAGEYYTTALRLDPGNVRALYARGIYYQEADSTELAIADYERILEIVPDFLSTNLNLGYIYLQKKEYERAVEYLTNAIDNSPDKQEAYAYRAQAYKELGKRSLAQADETRIKELEDKPDSK